MVDISDFSLEAKMEIASYIKRDNLDSVNLKLNEVHVKDTFYTRYGKRMCDIVIALIGLIITLPINLILAIATFFDVGSPIIFKQARIGRFEKPFTIYKFRNMRNDLDVNGQLLPPNQRVTKWGKFVRKTSLDELLNFVSVLNGSMSVIGPRPLMDYYAERLNNRHKMMYAVRPGLECPTPYKVQHVLMWQERLDNYVWYVENCSLYIDIKLMFRLVSLMFNRNSTSHRSNASTGGLLGYDVEGNVIYTKTCPQKYVEEYCIKHGYLDAEDVVNQRMAV